MKTSAGLQWMQRSLDEKEKRVVTEPLNLHSGRRQSGFDSRQERRKLGQQTIVLAARALDAFVRRETERAPHFLLPFTAGFRPVNDRIPMEDRVQPIIEEFAGGFFLEPSGAALCVDRRQNRIRISGAVRISPDDISRVLADFESQMEPHGSFGHAPQHRLKRFLVAIPHIFGVVMGMDSAEFVRRLEARGIPTTVRDTRGREIDGACGQLAAVEG